MADITDVENAIASIIGAAIYPNGTSQPSALPNAAKARIGPGWPVPSQLDPDLAAGNCQITIYPLGGAATATYQIQDQTYTITPPSYGLSFSVNDTAVTVSGTPTATEYLTLDVDAAHIFSRTGATVAAILAALLTDIQAYYPSASVAGNVLTIPGSHSIVARQGAQAILGKVIHRQRHSIMVSVWAPSDALRTAAAVLADVALKENIKITMPDSSQCILRYLRTQFSDQTEKADLYRRDLIYDAEFATVQQFPGYVITSTDITIADPTNTAIAHAIT